MTENNNNQPKRELSFPLLGVKIVRIEDYVLLPSRS
jgi:hypothetical protein